MGACSLLAFWDITLPLAFSKSVFSESVFSESLFSESVFSESVFSKSVFSKSVFPKVYFPKVYFLKVYFSKVYFCKVYFLKTFLIQSLSSPNFFKPSVPGEVRVFRALRACFLPITQISHMVTICHILWQPNDAKCKSQTTIIF